MNRIRLTVLLCLWLPALVSAKPAFEPLVSGPEQVQLIELYTSEGCSSCPPADRFLSALLNDHALWTKRVPVALHVDYWDYIGWKDEFASKEHSQRQRSHREQGNLSQVYTPGFVVDGDEWRGFFRGADLPSPSLNKSGILRLTDKNTHWQLQFETDSPTSVQLAAHVAVLGFGIETEVSRGENSGRVLQHDFVWLTGKRLLLDETQAVSFSPLQVTDVDAERLAVVAWLESKNQRVVQAVGGWLEQPD